MKNYFFPLILIFFGSPLLAVKTPEIRRIISNEVIKFENSVLHMKSTVEIYNPNLIALDFKKISLVFDGEKHKMAEGESQGEAHLKSKKPTEVSFEMKIYLDSMSTDYINRLAEKDSIELNCKVVGILGLLDIKITEKLVFSLATKDLIEPIKKDFVKNTNFNTKDIKLLKVDLSKINIMIPLTVQNAYPFDIKVSSVEIKMFSDANYKTKVGDLKDTTAVILKPGSNTNFEKEMILNTVESGLSGIFKAMQREFDYYIEGNIFVEFGKHKITVPLKDKIVIDPINGTIKQ